MRAATEYRDVRRNIKIYISTPAAKILGLEKLPVLRQALTDLMEALGAETAYVGKCGAAVEIHVLRSGGWRGHMKLKRGP